MCCTSRPQVDSFDSSRKEVSFSNSELSDTRAFRLHAAHTSEVQLIRVMCMLFVSSVHLVMLHITLQSALSVRRALFQGLKTVFSGKPVRFSDWQRISHGVSEALSLLITISPGHDAIDCKDAVAKR